VDLGRTLGIIAAVLLLIGAAVFFLFRYVFSVERLQNVQNAMGIESSQPEHHVLPEGFGGWAFIEFGVDGAPPLDVSDGVLVVEYPANGRVATSTLSPDANGFLHREFFERQGDALVPLDRFGRIWGEYNKRIITDEAGGLVQRSFGFFVGTMAEFNAAGRPSSTLELPTLPAVPPQPN
jgi:hypothetical protein